MGPCPTSRKLILRRRVSGARSAQPRSDSRLPKCGHRAHSCDVLKAAHAREPREHPRFHRALALRRTAHAVHCVARSPRAAILAATRSGRTERRRSARHRGDQANRQRRPLCRARPSRRRAVSPRQDLSISSHMAGATRAGPAVGRQAGERMIRSGGQRGAVSRCRNRDGPPSRRPAHARSRSAPASRGANLLPRRSHHLPRVIPSQEPPRRQRIAAARRPRAWFPGSVAAAGRTRVRARGRLGRHRGDAGDPTPRRAARRPRAASGT